MTCWFGFFSCVDSSVASSRVAVLAWCSLVACFPDTVWLTVWFLCSFSVCVWVMPAAVVAVVTCCGGDSACGGGLDA